MPSIDDEIKGSFPDLTRKGPSESFALLNRWYESFIAGIARMPFELRDAAFGKANNLYLEWRDSLERYSS